MTDFTDIAQRYVATWNETDATRRRALIDGLYAPDARYTDPTVQLAGTSAIDEFVAGVQQQFTGYVFSLGSPVDAHHDQSRFHWHATAPGATDPAYVGFDVIVAQDGRVRDVYGFIDRAPSS